MAERGDMSEEKKAELEFAGDRAMQAAIQHPETWPKCHSCGKAQRPEGYVVEGNHVYVDYNCGGEGGHNTTRRMIK
jgi:hypothetical protein